MTTRGLLLVAVLGTLGFVAAPVAAHAQTTSAGAATEHDVRHADGAQQAGQEAHREHGTSPAPVGELPAFIPALTDADRQAAFPDVGGHDAHDTKWHSFVLFDQLEWRQRPGTSEASWDMKGWLGKDRDRLWFRSEGEGNSTRLGASQSHLLYGRAISPWWDVVAGVRHDVRPGGPRTWAAIGLQGLAPYWFEVEATAYVGAGGRTHLRVETEYDLLVTNRLILQPLVELELYGKADPERRVGAGLSHADAGLRLRYEFRREVAPYVGVLWNRRFFGTADLARAAGDRTAGARLVIGVRLWR